MSKLRILFVHSSYPAHFSVLHRYLSESQLAESCYLTSAGCHRKFSGSVQNLFAFEPDGSADASYRYTRRIEKAYRISKGALLAVQNLVAAKRIDVIVAHSMFGSPVVWFDRFNVPIITYIEFPNFEAYGYDPEYPPTEEERQADTSLAMLSLYEVYKSDAFITPSEYVRGMFPEALRRKSFAQLEGIDPRFFRITGEPLVDRVSAISPVLETIKKHGRGKLVGFMARTLSSEKGFEHFIRISKRLIEREPNLHFLIIGGDFGAQYGFEAGYLERHFPGLKISFRDYVIQKHAVDLAHYHFAGYVEDERLLRDYVRAASVFLYPLQFGSGNWILLELLQQGQLVIASDRCHVPEIIEHDYNGLLCRYEDVDAWVETTLEALDKPEKYQRIRENAKEASERLQISIVARRLLGIYEQVIDWHAHRR